VDNLNSYLEHTLLKIDTSITDVRRICEEAVQYTMGGVCIPPLFVREAKRILGEESKTKVVTVIAFPMGYSALAAKTEEIKRALDEGADEIDGVINMAALKSGNWNHVENDIEGMALATNLKGKQFKLIIEIGLLTEEDLKRVVAFALNSRVKYLKTSTGMHGFPVTTDQVKLLRKIADPALKIKASGGVKTKQQAIDLIKAGADRIGTSAAMEILKG
jgi:deoxyribose-phosphate aldolase